MNKLTRRELAAVFATSTVLLAQAPPSATEETAASIAQNHALAGELDMFPLPMTAEPATIFKP
jgi:hypothetical protein